MPSLNSVVILASASFMLASCSVTINNTEVEWKTYCLPDVIAVQEYIESQKLESLIDTKHISCYVTLSSEF